jgi:hypothetical protein
VATNEGIDMNTSGRSRAIFSIVFEVYVTKLHILTWKCLAANNLHSVLSPRSVFYVLEANIADLDLRRNLKKKKKIA